MSDDYNAIAALKKQIMSSDFEPQHFTLTIGGRNPYHPYLYTLNRYKHSYKVWRKSKKRK